MELRPQFGGDCPKSQTFLSENRESDSGLVKGYGVFQSRKDFSDDLGGGKTDNHLFVLFDYY